MNRVFNVVILIAVAVGYVCGQAGPDWLKAEIESKRRALARRWSIKKPVSVSRHSYDVGYYKLSFSFDIEDKVLFGDVCIKAKSKIPGLQKIYLDFTSCLNIDETYGDVASIDRIGNLLKVSLSLPVDSGEVFSVGIRYHGTPLAAGFDGFSFSRTRKGVPVISTLSEPYFASGWFPCKDVPEDKADSVDIFITVPDTLTAVSNGKLVEVISRGDSLVTYHWKESYPIATYLISLAITKYLHWSDTYYGEEGSMPVDYWVYPECDSVAREVLPKTVDMIEFFSSIWGEYPFIKEKYGQAQFNWGGGMEHQTCTSIGGFDELLTCHELAHQWWGDMVTCANWHHIWLNEGFARYSEALWEEHIFGKGALCSYVESLDNPQDWGSDRVYVEDTTSVSNIFSLVVYNKGAWVLHMLRKVVGEDKFFDIFREYRNRYEYSVATTEDFKEVCEYIYGDTLDWFFDEWVYSTGRPHYYVSYSYFSEGDSTVVDIYLSQIQSGIIFKMPVDILITSSSGEDTLLTVWSDKRSQEYRFKLPGKFSGINVEIDPENWILKNVTYKEIVPELGYYPDKILLLEPYPNPFNDALIVSYFVPYAGYLRLSVVDILGREVGILKEGNSEIGYNRLIWFPSNLSSGNYFIVLKLKGETVVKKVMYLK